MRRSLIAMVVLLALAWALRLFAQQKEESVIVDKSRVVLEGVDRYRVMEPMFEGVRVILNYRGEKYSPAYIQGISGAAFRIAGICPCAPTCSTAMGPEDLVKLLGYQVESLPLSGEGIVPEKEVAKVVERVRQEIREDRPVLLWHAFTNAEWDVICGFDEKQGKFIGRGSYKGLDDYAVEDEERTIKGAHICPSLGAILIGEKKGRFDSRKAEIASLREAVKHAHSELNSDKLDGDDWVMLEGLACYDRWVSDFRDDPERKRGSGDAYCIKIYSSTRRAAAAYMGEIMGKYGEASAHLDEVRKHFAAEADALEKCVPLLGRESPEGPDAERNRKAAELLKDARDNYAEAIGEIEKALKVIDGDRDDSR